MIKREWENKRMMREEFEKPFTTYDELISDIHYCVNSYVAESGDFSQILTRLQILDTLINYGDKPFYAKDLGLCGGYVSGLAPLIIRTTGNSIETFIPLGDTDRYKKIEVVEWKLVFPSTELAETVKEFKKLMMNKIEWA